MPLNAAHEAVFSFQEDAMHDEILNVGEAADMLGVDRTTLWRMHAKYKMIAPPARFSLGKSGYLKSYLEGWMRQRMEEAAQGVG